MTLIACAVLALYGCKSPSGGQSGGIPMPQIPGAPQSSIPSIPSGGGLPGQPSSPGGLPSPGGSSTSSIPGGAPGGPPGLPGGQPGGEGAGDGQGDDGEGKGKGKGGKDGSQTAGVPGSPGGGSSGAPGGTQGNTSEQGGDWLDNRQEGAGDDGWATSNSIPEGKGSSTTGQSDTKALPKGGKLDEALDQALEDFDGEILEEREAIAKRNNKGGSTFPGGNTGTKTSAPGGDAAGGQNDTASLPNERAAPRTPNQRPSGNGRVLRDTPDAKGDDAFARQLREAATNETDPELQEKLWAEYKLYKGGS